MILVTGGLGMIGAHAARPASGRQDRPGENPYLEIGRLAADTGFVPAFDMATAVADYVAWRAEHPR
jgi:nucleoside-diphosphate-sugar epimerase